ncbi:MAG: hypothetical protein Q8R16_04455 [bacterium]|nr:hypothetical protein [bacterium]
MRPLTLRLMVARRIAAWLAILTAMTLVVRHLGGLSLQGAFAVAIAFPFLLYLPGRLLVHAFLPTLDWLERVTASVLLSMVATYTAVFIAEKTLPAVTVTAGVLAVVGATGVCGILALVGHQLRRRRNHVLPTSGATDRPRAADELREERGEHSEE